MADEKYKENLSLLSRAREGDESAIEELILLNVGLVKSIAGRFLFRLISGLFLFT